jgi:tetratricopeptide (TPR) repeat protein
MWNDADDISLPHRAAALVDALEGSAASFAHSDMLLIDGDGAALGYWLAAPVPPARMLQFLLRVGTPFNNPSMLVRAEVLSGSNFNGSLVVGTDTDMVSQFASNKAGVHVPEPLLLYRRWAGAATSAAGSVQETDQVEVLLGAHSPEEFVPEVKTGRDQECHRPVALALVALALVRRGLLDSGLRRLQAATSDCPEAARPLVAAAAALCEGNLHGAEICLSLCGDNDAIAVNLRGEIHAQRGEWTAATAAFRDALAIDPSYYEPVLNLRGAGGARGMNLVDRTWARFMPRAA